jgi:hypothetical protein
MRSSTSTFSGQYPEGPWLKTWLLTAALVLTLLAGWEITLRRLGHRPTVIDDMALWATQRARVYSDGAEKPVVLLGDCQMQLGLVPQVLAEQFSGRPVVQLAVPETSPVAVLRDLAQDQRFSGDIICEVSARLLCTDMWDTQQPYVDYYHAKFGWTEKLSRRLSAALQQRLVIFHPELRLDDIIVHVAKTGHLPSPYYIQTREDRSRLADYSLVDAEACRLWALGRAHWLSGGHELPTSVQWLQDAMQVDGWVKTIQARGGRVIFVQFPTTGEHFRYDEWLFPKAEYWDQFAAKTSAQCIHFRDLPQLAAFTCPDSVHLDRKDAPRFTLELAKVLEDRGVFRESSCTVARDRDAAGGPSCDCAGDDKGPIAQTHSECCSLAAPSSVATRYPISPSR